MFSHIIRGGDMQSYLISILLSLPIILLSLSLHETAHGFAAWRLGDPTARALGRLTLNPIKHLDPIGAVCMLLTGFGWAKPVPINSRYFKKPRRDIALTALAGPLSNLLLALLFLLLLRFVGYGWLWQITYSTQFAANAAYFFVILLYYGVSMNVTLALFNLLPLPPLDGSRILFSLLPPRMYFKIAPYERQITLALMVVVLVVSYFGAFSFLTRAIVKGLFSLFGMKGFLI